MRFKLTKTNSRFPGGRLPVIIFLAGMIATYFLHAFSTQYLDVCLFRRFIGINCPTCGISRSLMSLSTGDIVKTFSYNPLILIVTLLFIGYLGLQIIFKRDVVIKATKTEKVVLSIVLIFLFIINWLYVILTL